MNNIKMVIGDYQEFFSDLLHRMKKSGININGMPLSHLLYRTVTIFYNISLREIVILQGWEIEKAAT